MINRQPVEGPTGCSMPGLTISVSASNQLNSDNIQLLRSILYKLTGERQGEPKAQKPKEEEHLRALLSDTIQQAHEIEDLARLIFEAL